MNKNNKLNNEINNEIINEINNKTKHKTGETKAVPDRLPYLYYAKGIGILSVILFHTFGTIRISDPAYYKDFITNFMNTICIPIFFFVAGILLFNKGSETQGVRWTLRKKARAYLYPYLTFSILYLIHEWIRFRFDPSVVTKEDLRNILTDTLTLKGASVLWFFSALFFGEMFLYLFRRILKESTLLLIFTVLAGFIFAFSDQLRAPFFKENLLHIVLGNLLLMLIRGLLTVFYLLLGYFLGMIFDKLKERSIPSLLVGVLLLIFDGLLCMKMENVDYNRMNFGIWYWYFICSILGSVGVLLICRNLKKCRILEVIGTNSMLLMVTHLDFGILRNGLSLAYAINVHITHLRVPILYFNILWFVVLFEILIIFCIKKWFRFLYQI